MYYQAFIAWSETHTHTHTHTQHQIYRRVRIYTHAIRPHKQAHTVDPCRFILWSIYASKHMNKNTCWQSSSTHRHTAISILWHSAVRAAEEYDEYVFGTEQRDGGEEGIERKSRGKRDGGERERERERERGGGEEERKQEIAGKREMFLMTLETDRKTATQLPLQDFPLSLYLPAFLSFLSPSLWWQITSVRAKSSLKSSVFIWKNTAAASESVQHTGDQSHVYTLPHSRRDAEILRQALCFRTGDIFVLLYDIKLEDMSKFETNL